VFLLVPAYPGSPGPKAVKRLLLLFYATALLCNVRAVRQPEVIKWPL